MPFRVHRVPATHKVWMLPVLPLRKWRWRWGVALVLVVEDKALHADAPVCYPASSSQPPPPKETTA